MAAADRTNNTEQLQRFINNLLQHQQKNEFCDFTLTTNNTSIECHKLVLSSASSYFSQLLCDSEHNTNIIDVTPLPEHILKTLVAFMYNSEYVIDDENVIELLKFSGTWNLDILAKLCVEYMNDNVTINNACRFYNFALDNVDQHKSQIINEFIREHFTILHESGQLSELSLKNFTDIIEHDEINVKNEDVIFSSAVQIINQESLDEDINRCLDLIRFPHTSGDFLVNVVLDHQLMKEPPRDKYPREALLYQVNKRSTPEVKPPRYWGRSGIFYFGLNHCMYQYVSKDADNECVKIMNLPGWLNEYSSIASHRVVVGGYNKDDGACQSSLYYLSLDSDAWQTKQSMPYTVRSPLVIQHQQCIYVLGGYSDNGTQVSSVSQYNIQDDTWKQCGDMPVACDSDEAGVVVHEGRIKVITVDKCLMYADDTDTWTVKRYNKLGYTVNAFVRRGQICAVVQNDDDTYRMLSYDDVDNVWKTEHEEIIDAWYTWLFC